MKTRFDYLACLSVAGATLALAACGGGGGGGGSGSDPAIAGPSAPPPTTNPPPATTAGVWKGTVTSTSSGQTASVAALTGPEGRSVWMTTDGRVWDGHVPGAGDHFEAAFSGHMLEGAHFPDGTNFGPAAMIFDHHSASIMSGQYSGSGDAGTFRMTLSPMWDRPAAMETVAGVYTRSTSNGYTMTLAIDTDGQMTGSDSRGCVFSGTVNVADPHHNLYAIDASLSSCGTLDGNYQGLGTLLDADAMQDWMATMHPLEHGGHSHGGSSMGGHHGPGTNTVPGGQRNLFMFALANQHGAIMDALGR